MYLNWYTTDACFLTRSWRITSPGMFAGSCIGVILLVIAFEFLRRSSQAYDTVLLRRHRVRCTKNRSSTANGDDVASDSTQSVVPPNLFTPNVWQQLVRALLHMLQFAVAYFIMLLAMWVPGWFIKGYMKLTDCSEGTTMDTSSFVSFLEPSLDFSFST
jgi:solute carrier family 31 (copper transporter), member 1